MIHVNAVNKTHNCIAIIAIVLRLLDYLITDKLVHFDFQNVNVGLPY